MWSIRLLSLLSFSVYAQKSLTSQGSCPGSQLLGNCVQDGDVITGFRESFDPFYIKLFKAATRLGNYQTIFAPQMTWLTLAAIAEGTQGQTRDELFNILNLPKDSANRQKYYQLATSVISKTQMFDFNRNLFIDQGSQLNTSWFDLLKNGLLQVTPVPIKLDPKLASERIKEFASLKDIELDLSGNSAMVNSMNYVNLWTTSFADAVIERSPFYSYNGMHIGFIDLMRVKRKVRIANAYGMFAKIIEIPVGVDGEYRMVLGLQNNDTIKQGIMEIDNDIVKNVVDSMEDSNGPIEVAIPVGDMNMEVDMKKILQDMGISNLWQDAEATSYISTPPAEPRSYVQRVSVKLSPAGINPIPSKPVTSLHDKEDHSYNFIVNRPYAFGIYDAKTYTNIWASVRTKPMYPIT